MTWASRLERLVPDLSATLIRFPVPSAISLLLCLWLNAFDAPSDTGGKVIAAGVAAFMASGAAALFAEGRQWQRSPAIILTALAAAVAGLAGYQSALLNTSLLFLLPGLLLLIMIAPFLRRGVSQGAVWLFNLRFGLAALLAAVVALIFGLGLSALVEALDVLFGLGTGNLHENIWFTAMSLVAPLYGLSLMPRELSEEVDISPQKGSLIDRGISVLVNYVAVPVIAAYTLILHAYAAKILFEAELPNGQIAAMVSIFAIGGTAVWIIAWPWREAGTRLLRLFMRYWFFLLLVPSILLVIAIWRRVSDYGVTPERYGIVLVAFWVAALILYLAARRNRADMRVMLGAAAILLLAGSIGPLGAHGLTISSQFARLSVLLQTAGVLKDGKITSKGLLATGAAGTGHSIIQALKDVDGLDRLKPWFEGDAKSPFANPDAAWNLAQLLSESLGFSQASMSQDYVTFNANLAVNLEMPAGGTIYGPFQDQRLFSDAKPQEPMTSVSDEGSVNIRLDSRTFRVDQKRLLEEAKARLAAKPSSQGPIDLEIEPGVTMLVDNLSGNLAVSPPLHSLRFWIILRPAP